MNTFAMVVTYVNMATLGATSMFITFYMPGSADADIGFWKFRLIVIVGVFVYAVAMTQSAICTFL